MADLQLKHVSGDGQTLPAGEVFAPYVVQVLDGAGAPKPAVAVKFTVTDSEGAEFTHGLTSMTVLSDENGKAISLQIRSSSPGRIAGAASSKSTDDVVTFTLTAT